MPVDLVNALVLLANFVVVPAIAYGSQLALGALGITLVYGILRFANFSHGDLMAFGTMATILATWQLQGWGIGLGVLPTAMLALPAGIVAAVLAALAADRTVFRFYRIRRSSPMVLSIASVGVMFVLNGLVRVIIGPDDRSFADGTRYLLNARQFKEATGLAEGLTVRTSQLLTLAVAVVAVAALFWFLRRTRAGKAMRAYSDNEDLALLSGVEPGRVVLTTWVIAASLAAVAGSLYGLDKSFQPFTYMQLLLPMFAAAIVGGIGQPHGAIAGGFLVAFSEIALTYPYRKFLRYLLPEDMQPDGLMQLLSTDYKLSVSFVILVVVLLWRPTGLFRGRVL
ncbi:MAG: branched-chain amino acid ABC transporter permease [Defluviicoccus sp.]|nr:branched-chain amino acid ABC transporter permease [Defluviicoccus sp.]